jgi:hypothetical protein
MASLLDPRMKARIGIPDLFKGHVWRMIRDEVIHISIEAFEPEVQIQPQQEQDKGAKEEPQPQWN